MNAKSTTIESRTGDHLDRAVSRRAALPVSLASSMFLWVGGAEAQSLRTADFSGNGFSDFSATSSQNGDVRVTTGGDARRHMVATMKGQGRIAFARAQWTLSNWQVGTEWTTRFQMMLPKGFYARQTCTFQPFGWDTWPVAGNQMRMMVYPSDKRARMVLRTNNRTREISNTFNLPEGRWVGVRVSQKIGVKDGWTRVYLGGTLVAQGSGSTYTGATITNMRYGFADCSGQKSPLSVFMRDIVLENSTAIASAE